MVIIRKNEEALCAGVGHRQAREVYQCLMLITRPGCEQIVRYAFEYARSNKRKKVTCLNKDNIMKMTDLSRLQLRGFRNEVIGDWLNPLKALPGKHSGLKVAKVGTGTTADTLAELNVVQQSINFSRTSLLRDAWARGKQVTIQGVVFDPLSGSLSRFCDPISSAVSR